MRCHYGTKQKYYHKYMLKKIFARLKKIEKIETKVRTHLLRYTKKTHHTPPAVSESSLLRYAGELRERIINLENNSADANTTWQKNMKDLRLSIINGDPRNFIAWEVIRATMFHHCSKRELTYLKKTTSWREYKKNLQESTVGNPPPYPYLPLSSGNLIHNLYHIAQLTAVFKINIKDLKNIFEFGGGYGSNCRLLYNMGFHGTYTIYDLPEFSAIQKYFLSCVGIYSPKKIALITSTTEAEKAMAHNNAIDLFIATWSISESPISVREKIWALISDPTYILIVYQNTFEEIDNRKYFANFKEKRHNYEWVEYEIPHLHGSHYLFGKRKKI